jgi:general secretion pathway protein C
MLTPTPATWTVRGATFALWALAAGSAALWGLKLGGDSAPALAPLPPARAVMTADPGAVARLLGGAPAMAGAPAEQPTLASRFQIVGVVAGERSGGGAAVISVDGRPARPYRVGARIDEGLVLQSVRGRTASIGASMTTPPVLTLELPALRADLPPQPAATAAPR